MIKKYNKLFFIGLILILFIIFIILFFRENLSLITFAQEKESNLEVIFLDVGQGDAILIKTPDGQNILIDGGEGEKVIKRLSEKLPWWDKKIDLMILTHPHSDHVGGLVEVLKRYEVLKILYTGVNHNSPDYIAWLELIKEKNISLNIINHPQKILLGDSCFLDIIYPNNQSNRKEQISLNNSSIVSKLSYGQNSFLFMGDAEKEVEKVLLDNKEDLEADILKIGHHGSDTSSAGDFLKAVNPSYAVIEVGVDNDFGHPSPRIIKRLERLGIKIFRTDIDGNISFRSDGKVLKIIN